MKAINPLDYPICFARPLRLLHTSSWIQHVPFGMFIIELLRPKVVVELGTHMGVSYSAFCQAVKQLKLNTRCYAFDTWEGDIHVGHYGADVLVDLRAHHDPLYGEFSQLVQTTFDEAVGYFPDGSIDFLHLDGTHTYEAVKHDFETWLPKLSNQGVFLLHDTNVREHGFGVWKLWMELQSLYPHFEFFHEHGLGLLYVGSKPLPALEEFLSMSEAQSRLIREFFYTLGSKLSMEAGKDHEMQLLDQQVAEKEQAVQALTAQVTEKEQVIQTLTARVSEKEKVRQALTTQLAEAKTTAASATAHENEREQILQALNAKLWEIYGSRAWRLIRLLWKMRLALIPPGSRRARALRLLYSLLSSPVKKLILNREVKKNIELINSSGLFDKNWYLSKYPDIAQEKIDPVSHFLLRGGFEGKDPSPNFSSKWYLDNYPYVLATKTNPLLDYLISGKQQGRLPHFDATLAGDIENLRTRAFQIVPYYLDPYAAADINTIQGTPRIAVHLHLHYRDMLEQCIKYLNNIPFPFDLYVSTTDKNNPDEITAFLQKHINCLSKVIVKLVPNCGRDLAPIIIEFGENLLNYDFIAHIHTKKSPHNPHLASWFEEIMDSLLGSTSGICQILKLLSNDAKFVYPAPSEKILMTDQSKWGDNYKLAETFLPKLLGEKITSYPLVEFPQGSMFWAKSNALSRFLRFPLKYTDFPTEPIPPDGTLLHVLERLLLISASKLPGRNYRIYLSSSTIKEPYFETQNDYSNSLVYRNVKVLTYYLPQFYPIPENDKWHGKGFTEWNKVRRANPLFYGHDQQRVPHQDLGYYSLTSPEMLKKHAELMKQSGVYGQIFYHYWFTGKLILEKPVQMLLADKSIEIPFCFCWANENWTRKWDGNENEILLGQKYSEQDAIRFINYLIPFFEDKRYIRIEGRPVLYIYRPASIPNFEIYKQAWEKACAENGIEPPFIVAVLTRGARSPRDYGMDAGCERVLHDWTGGNVKEIKNWMYPYWPINGSVLNYDEVADYYMSQQPDMDFTYFRSLIPSWDNTPRYGSEAFIVDRSTPEKFQKWLEVLIADAEERLPEDRRFVVINAWNEWAESAILEPDSRFGYAYLNSVGRALSGIKFTDREYLHQAIPETLKVSLYLSDHLLNTLQTDEKLRQKMLSSVTNSTFLLGCEFFPAQPQLAQWLSSISSAFDGLKEKNIKPDYTLYLKDVCYLALDTIENMLKMALQYDAGIITPTHLNDPKFTHQHLLNRWETNQISPYMILFKNDDKRSTKCCVDARIFITEPQATRLEPRRKVSTIIRYNKSGDLTLLQNALYSLIAQIGCAVQPVIAVQDLTDDRLADFEAMLAHMPWDEDCQPILKRYYSTESNPDLRSLMLNDALKTVQTKFAAVLDYDDILFHDAYSWLIERLQKTQKNASFGLTYNVVFNLAERQIKKRYVVYDYGTDYQNFLLKNHSPIHSIMFNLSKIDLNQIEYYEDMKFMEDYYLTLQIFTEDGTDWESLKERKFIGDYYHFEDRTQTLAILDQEQRSQSISSPEYAKCEARIHELRQKIRKK